MSRDIDIEVTFRANGVLIDPTPEELALVMSTLPELLAMLHTLDESTEDDATTKPHSA